MGFEARLGLYSAFVLARLSDSLPFECNVGVTSTWTEAKKAWCCQNEGEGCRYDCHVEPVDSWTGEKRDWCCKVRGSNCPTTSRFAFDCNEGIETWKTGWSMEKKVWCCTHANIGCSPDANPVLFDCSTLDDDWEVAWSREKKEWCCEHDNKACNAEDGMPPSRSPATSMSSQETPKADYLLSAGRPGCAAPCVYKNFSAACTDRIQWSAWNKFNGSSEPCVLAHAWVLSQCDVCSSCTTASSKCVPFNCSASSEEWTDVQTSHCCSTHGKGCWKRRKACNATCHYHGEAATCSERVRWAAGHGQFEHTPNACAPAHHLVQHQCPVCELCALKDVGCNDTSSPPGNRDVIFDCNAELRHWKIAWSMPKRNWCCQHESKGCSSANAGPFDCSAGFDNWQDGWSSNKKEWCCVQESKGCSQETPVSAPPVPYDCLDDSAQTWDGTKTKWCCGILGEGCLTTTAATTTNSQRFDCQAGWANSQAGWSPEKMGWCCAQAGRGCTTMSLTTQPVTTTITTITTTTTATSTTITTTTTSKTKTATSSTTQTATSTSTTSPRFDCQAGFRNWQFGWSDEKKTWCCKRTGKTCAILRSTSTPFNCVVGLKHWETTWSVPHKVWCCRNFGKGCEGNLAMDFTCIDDEGTWSAEEGTWCCQNLGRGCNSNVVRPPAPSVPSAWTPSATSVPQELPITESATTVSRTTSVTTSTSSATTPVPTSTTASQNQAKATTASQSKVHNDQKVGSDKTDVTPNSCMKDDPSEDIQAWCCRNLGRHCIPVAASSKASASILMNKFVDAGFRPSITLPDGRLIATCCWSFGFLSFSVFLAFGKCTRLQESVRRGRHYRNSYSELCLDTDEQIMNVEAF